MDTNLNDTKIEGVGTIHAGNYGKVKVEGVGKLRGDINFIKMGIEGTCNASGNLTGAMMDIEGILKVDGDIKVKELDVEGLLKTGGHKIYADEIRVEGLLKNSGEVNADKVLIDGCIEMNELFGENIIINYGGGFHFFGAKNFFGKMNRANTIECTNLKACNMSCHSISAYEIELRDHCVIDTIHCDGSLKYDNTCRIKHIEGDCIQK